MFVVLLVAATALALLVATAGHMGSAVGSSGSSGPAAPGPATALGGSVWYVMAVGAAFEPHLFTFHSDGSMLSHNPEAGDKNTSDSAGMGPWKSLGRNKYKGRFVEINANYGDAAVDPHKFNSNLVVDFTITVTGNTFNGPAVANYYDAAGKPIPGLTDLPATLNGRLITFNSPWPRGTIVP